MAKASRTKPRIIFNTDGDSTTLTHFEPPITPQQLCRPLDEVAGTQVDVFIHCLNRGDDTYSHRTGIGDVFGADESSWPPGPRLELFKRMAANTRAILDRGLDPIAVLAERARQHGIAFWAGLRMNDIHEDDSRRFAPLRSPFKMRHPELVIGSPYPDPRQGYPQDDFTWAYDYAHPQVRDRRLAIIEEACGRYDLDGFELDFQRGPWFFKPGCQTQGMPLMTEFVRRVRRAVNAIAERRGRPITLAYRIPPTIGLARAKGLDVETWISEGLADVFVPMDGGYLDTSVDLVPFRELARASGCLIAGGIEPAVKGYGGRATIETLRAAAAALHHQGAQAIYLFNYDCHRAAGRDNPYTDWELEALRQIGDPQSLVAKDKHYLITRDTSDLTVERGGTKPLPVEVAPGESRTFRMVVADDLEYARRRDTVEQIRLNLTLAEEEAYERLELGVNGKEVPVGRKGVYEEVPIRQGTNELCVSSSAERTVRIDGIELFIRFRRGI
ncbi:MAG: hypothetical protein GXY33_12850 [Phycisphaerae bacterium]|nr:hypothetical protein [Phycisphaerae bacterium]